MSNNINTKKNSITNHVEYMDIPEPKLIQANTLVVPTAKDITINGATKIAAETYIENYPARVAFTLNSTTSPAVYYVEDNYLKIRAAAPTGNQNFDLNNASFDTLQEIVTYLSSVVGITIVLKATGTDKSIKLKRIASTNISGVTVNVEMEQGTGDIYHKVKPADTWSPIMKTFPDLYNTKNAQLSNVKDFTLQYVGAGTAATVTVTGNTMTTTITGGPGGEDLSINLTNTSYDTLTKLLAYINGFGGGGVYEAFAMPNIDTSIASTTIQNVAALDIKTSAQNLGQTNRTLVTFNAYNTATSVYDKWQGYIPYWEWNTGIKDNLITALVPSLQLRNI